MNALDQGLAARQLAQHGIAPTPQRVAVACVKRRGTRVSKATVYNTCSPGTGSCAS